MPAHPLSPRTQRIYTWIRERIRSGEIAPGEQLPPHKQLASEFGVAPMTVRQVLARLEEDGLVSRQVGRGTFVRAVATARVLVFAHARVRHSLHAHLESAGQTAIFAHDPDEALHVLASDRGIELVLAEVASGATGVADRGFVQHVRRRWPSLPLAAVVASSADLAKLWELRERPLLVLSSPPAAADVLDVVRFALPRKEPVQSSAEQNEAALGGLGALVDVAGLETLKFQARLLDSVAQAVIATGPRGDILYWNHAAERLYGWRADEVLGRNAGEVIVAPEQYARGKEIMERLRTGEIWSGEFLLRRRDGTETTVLVTDSPVRDPDGRLVGIIGVSMDISARKQAERVGVVLEASRVLALHGGGTDALAR